MSGIDGIDRVVLAHHEEPWWLIEQVFDRALGCTP
jgi:hypothetical protein